MTVKDKGIYCEKCERRIQNFLSGKEGIKTVTSDQETQKVKLYYDKDVIDKNEIIDLLDEIGYPAE